MLADPSLEPLTALVEALKGAWRAGAAPDAPGALLEHPELLRYRSLVVDLAYEEYCVLEEAGAAPEPEAFCGLFPAFRSEIREVIRGHRLLADHPELMEGAPPWPRPDDRFEQLTVVRELGRGAFARVYLARDPEAGDRPVVLKLAPGPSREARTLGPLAHPHIVPVLWARRSGGFDAVCMPFVGTTTLRDAVESAFRTAARSLPAPTDAGSELPPIPPARARAYPDWVAAVAARLAGAVEHLHRSGVVHGDLKPSNVLLGPGGHPYLIDFNLSTGLVDTPLRCGGTLPYMPPERLRRLLGGGPEPTPGAAADVYSFGVVLFEILTGRVPVEPIDVADANAVAADLLRRLTARRPTPRTEVPAALAALVESCLAPDPGRRPTISQVKCDLDRYLTRRARGARRAAIGLCAVAAVVGLAALFLRPPPEPSAPSAPESPVRTLAPPAGVQPAVAEDHFAQGLRHLKGGSVAAAMRSFDDADRLRPDGPSAAYFAYCHALSGQHRAAVALYERAIREHGFAPAWVHNNLAYSLIQSGSTAAKLRAAQNEARAALSLSAGLRAGRLNRVYAQFRLALAEGKLDQPDPEALADVRQVMAEPPYSADLYVKAAVMTVVFGGERPEGCARAVGYLEEAVRLGRPPATFASDPVLRRRLSGRTDFARLLERPTGPGAPATFDPHLVRPPLD